MRRPILRRMNVFLQAPLGGAPRALLVLAALLIAATWFAPLWDMTMFAPQYGNGLRLHIFSHGLVGGNGGQDLKEINLLNHYIGMRDLAPEEFPELLWMPFAFGALALLFLRAAFFGTVGSLVDVTVMFVYFGSFSLFTFARKLWVYGHELAPNAPVKVAPFTPPMLGGQQIANFEVYSYPGISTYLVIAASLALLVALGLAWRDHRAEARTAATERGAARAAEA